MTNEITTPYGQATYHIDPNNQQCVVSFFPNANLHQDPTKIKVDEMYPNPPPIGWKRDMSQKPKLDERYIHPFGTRLLFMFAIIPQE